MRLCAYALMCLCACAHKRISACAHKRCAPTGRLDPDQSASGPALQPSVGLRSRRGRRPPSVTSTARRRWRAGYSEPGGSSRPGPARGECSATCPMCSRRRRWFGSERGRSDPAAGPRPCMCWAGTGSTALKGLPGTQPPHGSWPGPRPLAIVDLLGPCRFGGGGVGLC